ncbi:MAG TPA: DUF805 domain-containing protein [Caulobacteraceae bacterium]
MQLLFGFNGRIRRTNYWLGSIGASFALSAIFWILFMILGGAGVMAVHAAGGDGSSSAGAAAAGGTSILVFVLIIAYAVALTWVGLALQIKRWHDRDKSGVWVFINFIPFVGGIWTFIECGFMDGTLGPNRFGPSPKGIQGQAMAAPVTPTAPVV